MLQEFNTAARRREDSRCRIAGFFDPRTKNFIAMPAADPSTTGTGANQKPDSVAALNGLVFDKFLALTIKLKSLKINPVAVRACRGTSCVLTAPHVCGIDPDSVTS